jgi:hypothetical protein
LSKPTQYAKSFKQWHDKFGSPFPGISSLFEINDTSTGEQISDKVLVRCVTANMTFAFRRNIVSYWNTSISIAIKICFLTKVLSRVNKEVGIGARFSAPVQTELRAH